MSREREAGRTSVRRGFLALVAGLALAACDGHGDVESPRRELDSDVEVCAARLRELYQGMVNLERERGWQPTEPGAIPGDLVATGFWTPADTDPDPRLRCPGGAYAARDLAAHPLERFPTRGTEPLMACANADGRNHEAGATNVLYADGSVVTLDLHQEIEAGRLPEGTTKVPVGPGSPLEDLAKLAGP